MNNVKRSIGDVVERIERATSMEELKALFLDATHNLGFEFASLFGCTPARPGRGAAIHFARLPAGWFDHYVEQRYYEFDPVFDAVGMRATPFDWGAPEYRQRLTKAQKALLAECAAAGLGSGFAVAIKGPGATLSCCMLVPDRGGVDPESYLLGHSLAVFVEACAQRQLGEALVGPSVLTKREHECLFLAARGKTDWEIGEVLGISERTVHHAIESAKRRYGAATRVQAIVQAIAAGEFSAADAIG